jgi:hypothetical protein
MSVEQMSNQVLVMKIIQMKANLEAQMLSLETANVTIVANEGMMAGLNAQRQVNKLLNVEEIGELHQDIEEHLNNADEASRILATGFNAGEVFDEDELLAELNLEMQSSSNIPASKKVEANDIDELNKLMSQMPSVSVEATLPVAPTASPALDHSDSSYDLRRLQEEMGL